MHWCEDSCGHRSVPVETDEAMTSSSLNLACSVCEQCLDSRRSDVDPVVDEYPSVTINTCKVDYPDELWGEPSRGQMQVPSARGTELSLGLNPQRSLVMNNPSFISWMDEPPPSKDAPVRSYYKAPKEPPSLDPGSLEAPLSLHSDYPEVAFQRPVPCHLQYYNSPIPPQHHPVCVRPCAYMPPVDAACQRYCPNTEPVQDPHHPKPNKNPKRIPGQVNTAPVREIMTEVCPTPSLPAHCHIPAQEAKKTISLPDNCRNLFITYSIDTAKDIPTFVSFLMTQGFRPAIDIFDDPVRRLDINKWMDSFLKDKSVLIIMVISPKYKIDIEGDGSDEHGLHTKYIHNQLQNEFIQQRCLNFRLVPVLFPNATREHVPIWLQSTRIYQWPRDMQDLLLRLLREERYIPPPMGKELTLTIRPI
ncbi:hypothetical protein ACEWY4_021765 [Coilia grayii]|uniref:E3 ubiquitin ligase TRAF3IP2 n=1 Tax=Coilia grayii TaxID=363190 RepID=A0ABD1J445_9TELE